jgi:hypothetical protein
MPAANRTTELLKPAQSVMSEDRWPEAIRLLKQTSALVEKHRELGCCYFKLERMNDARKYLARATKLATENHACKFNRSENDQREVGNGGHETRVPRCAEGSQVPDSRRRLL